MVNIKYDLLIAAKHGINKYPKIVIKELGITYKRYISFPIIESFQFHDCCNIPVELPEYICVLETNN